MVVKILTHDEVIDIIKTELDIDDVYTCNLSLLYKGQRALCMPLRHFNLGEILDMKDDDERFFFKVEQEDEPK